MIVAKDKNSVIGKDNQLIWSIPNDLRYFKEVTMGKTVVMGRKTYESIGKPLPGRDNIVLTNNKSFLDDRVTVVNSIEEVLAMKSNKEIVVIGGDSVYQC